MRPLETFSTSSISCGSRPALTPIASASAVIAIAAWDIRLFASLSVCPRPGFSPTKNTLPRCLRIVSTSSNAARGPDTMRARVPARAPAMPPLTGASSEWMPRSAKDSSIAMAAAAPEVDRSTKVRMVLPSRMPVAPRTTSSTICGVGRLANTMRAVEATAAADSARVAPRDSIGRVAASLASQTVTGYPAASNRSTIAPPMRPTPMKPIGSLMFFRTSRCQVDPDHAFESGPGTWVARQHQRIVPRNEMLRRACKRQRRALRLNVGGEIIEDRKRPAGLEIGVKVRGVGTEHDPTARRGHSHDCIPRV